jgi:DNA-binding Xre family transcriptional regulator
MQITIKNRLSVLLRMRGIRSASEFGRRMTAAGFPMSSSHASRFEKEDLPAIDLRFINAACNVLQCMPDHLFDIRLDLEPDEVLDPLVDIPRHAAIFREGQVTAAQSIPSAQTIAPTSKATTMPTQPQAAGSKAKGGAKSKSIDPDTGPKVTLFPYGKS